MVLLHVLQRLGHPITVHVDHGLQGAESDADRSFVEEQARRCGWPCQSVRVDVRAEAAKPGCPSRWRPGVCYARSNGMNAPGSRCWQRPIIVMMPSRPAAEHAPGCRSSGGAATHATGCATLHRGVQAGYRGLRPGTGHRGSAMTRATGTPRTCGTVCGTSCFPVGGAPSRCPPKPWEGHRDVP